MKKCSLIILIVIFSLLCACGKTPINNQSSNNTSSILEEKFVEIKGSEIKKIEMTDNANIILTNNGEVYAWGTNSAGILGLGKEDKENVKIPQKISFDEPIKDVVAPIEGTSVIALSESGNVYAWGTNDYRMFVGIDELVLNTPQKLSIPFEVEEVGFSIHFLTVKDKEGNYYHCGWDMEGEYLGWYEPDNKRYSGKLEIISELDDKNIKEFYTEYAYRSYIDINGDVFVQGLISQNQGMEPIKYYDFTKIDYPEKIIKTGSVNFGMIALSQTGKLYFTGFDLQGIKDNIDDSYLEEKFGEIKYYENPVLIEKFEQKIVDFETGGGAIVVKDENNNFFTVGYNYSCNSAQSENFIISTPTKLNLPADTEYIKYGRGRGVAIDSKGQIYGWGSNYQFLFCNEEILKQYEPEKITFKTNS